jgi:hypothetical protein
VSRGTVVIALLAACGGQQGTARPTAGDNNDEGAGVLARASLHLRTGSDGDDDSGSFGDDSAPTSTLDMTRRSVYGTAPWSYGATYGGDPYGGLGYGGLAYGGASYASWVPPQWQYSPRPRDAGYAVVPNAIHAIEGAVTWAGPPPGKVVAPCGTIDNPTLHVGSDRAARGVLVYIEHVTEGRAIPYYTRPVSVGGAVAKRGCTFVPAVSIVAPLPGPLSIHGDDTRTRIRILPDKGAGSTHELEEGGLVQVDARAGVTRIDSDDGKVSAAWVIGIDSPYVTLTDDAGRYRLDELPPGTYEVTFWQPPVASIAANGTWSYGPPAVVRRSVKVGAATTHLSVTLSPGVR